MEDMLTSPPFPCVLAGGVHALWCVVVCVPGPVNRSLGTSKYRVRPSDTACHVFDVLNLSLVFFSFRELACPDGRLFVPAWVSGISAATRNTSQHAPPPLLQADLGRGQHGIGKLLIFMYDDLHPQHQRRLSMGSLYLMP